MSNISIEQRFTVDADVDQVWSILVDDFVGVSAWATGVVTSTPNPDAVTAVAPGAPTGRVCEVPGFGVTDERVVEFDPDRKVIAYSVDAEKIPSFVHDMTNRWTLTRRGSSTEVHMRLTAGVSGPLGALTKPMMRRKLVKQLDLVVGDLTAWVETGRPSASKAKELAVA